MTGQSTDEEVIMQEALAWRTALEREDADWDGYMAWLERDPRHRDAFNSVDVLTVTIDAHREELGRLLAPPSAEVPPPSRFGKRLLAVGGLAAAAAFAVALPTFRAPEQVQSYQADGGTQRVVSLAGGTTVTLSPASRIVVHGEEAGRIEVARGEAFFEVRHDPSRTLTVAAGDYRVTDIGTRFSVSLASGAFRVGVADGEVAVSSAGMERTVKVTAGHQLVTGGGDLTLSAVAVADVASWRSGRLSYSDAPLSLVTADIARYSGQRISIDPSLEDAHFSGSLVIGDGSRLLRDVATIMGAEVRTSRDGDRIGAADR